VGVCQCISEEEPLIKKDIGMDGASSFSKLGGKIDKLNRICRYLKSNGKIIR
jgi:hypothetical protein